MMMHEVQKKANFSLPRIQLGSYFRIKQKYDAHIAYVAETYISAIMPGFRFFEFVGVSQSGMMSGPIIIVRAVHEETLAFGMAEATRDVFINFDAFTSESKMWAHIDAALARHANHSDVDLGTRDRVRDMRVAHGLELPQQTEPQQIAQQR